MFESMKKGFGLLIGGYAGLWLITMITSLIGGTKEPADSYEEDEE